MYLISLEHLLREALQIIKERDKREGLGLPCFCSVSLTLDEEKEIDKIIENIRENRSLYILRGDIGDTVSNFENLDAAQIETERIEDYFLNDKYWVINTYENKDDLLFELYGFMKRTDAIDKFKELKGNSDDYCKNRINFLVSYSHVLDSSIYAVVRLDYRCYTRRKGKKEFVEWLLDKIENFIISGLKQYGKNEEDRYLLNACFLCYITTRRHFICGEYVDELGLFVLLDDVLSILTP